MSDPTTTLLTRAAAEARRARKLLEHGLPHSALDAAREAQAAAELALHVVRTRARMAERRTHDA